jgi:hypothetical protein
MAHFRARSMNWNALLIIKDVAQNNVVIEMMVVLLGGHFYVLATHSLEGSQ